MFSAPLKKRNFFFFFAKSVMFFHFITYKLPSSKKDLDLVILRGMRKIKIKKERTTAPRIPAWSPTVVLTRRHSG